MTEILLKFKKPHKEENKLPPNSKIQKTDPLLVSLRFGTRPFTFANRQKAEKVSAPFGCRILKNGRNRVASFIGKFDFEPR